MPRSEAILQKIPLLFQEVEKPGRYTGNEINSVRKDPAQVRLRVALVFPDVYEMGESHVGLKILYKLLNDQPHIWAERVYAPWPDMEQALIRHDLPLFSLESRLPLHEFDLVGVTLPYELVYTNILTILKRGGIPLWNKDRREGSPIVIGGGTCAFNPEPVADFFDAIVVGDGEDLILKLARQVLDYKEQKQDREALLKSMARETGVYVPSFFEMDYHDDGTLKKIHAKLEGYPGVEKATVTDLDRAAYPVAPIVPNVGVIHDRIGVEVQRGCVRACRFCQAGYIYRPERQRSPDTVKRIVKESLANTGQEEVSLLSLSVGDYEPLNPLLNELFDRHEKDSVAISLPATRTETLTPDIIRQIKRVRKTGFTIAPEAGTPRMRRLINKGNERSDLMNTVEHVFREGWRLIKFYYMCGLPMELESDVLGIAEEATLALQIGRRHTANPQINVSVSSFVPKPFTPFQWEPQLSIEEVEEKHELLRRRLKGRGLNFKYHNVEMSYLEGVFSRGDRRLAKVVIRAYELGCRFDEWHEHFRFDLWRQAFQETGVDPDFYTARRRSREEILPWDHLFTQMKKDFLWEEFEAAHDLAFIEDCSTHRCTDCGVCDFRTVKNVNYQYLPETGQVQAHSTRRRVLKGEPEQSLTNPHGGDSEKKVLKTKLKLRARYTKLGEAAYLGHLDLMTVLRRAIARAEIPVGFSQGFHPQRLLSMGPPQSLGVESDAEFVDMELAESMSPREFLRRINGVLPQGIRFLEAWAVAMDAPSLNGTLREQAYDIEIESVDTTSPAASRLEKMVHALNRSSEIKIQRRRAKQAKTVDIKPYIKDLEFIAPNRLHLVTHFGQTTGTVRPKEVLEALFSMGEIPSPPSRIRKVGALYRQS
jgi:radical SAM family uncharacterized protein/radical SAM-linked protein